MERGETMKRDHWDLRHRDNRPVIDFSLRSTIMALGQI
jgi:hypothetical protein